MGQLGRIAVAVERVLDLVVRCVAVVAAMAVVVMVAASVREVVGRYAFNAPTEWADELSGYLVSGIAFLAAAYSLRRGDLVAMSIMSDRMPPRWRYAGQSVGLLVSVGVLALIVYHVGDYVMATHAASVVSNSSWRVPLWIPRAVILCGLAVLLLETVRQFVVAVTNSVRAWGGA